MRTIPVAKKYYYVQRIDSDNVFVNVKRFEKKDEAETYACQECMKHANKRANFFVREGFSFTEEPAPVKLEKQETKKPTGVKSGKTNSKEK